MNRSFVKYAVIVSAAIFLRSIVSDQPYSGFNKPPMYGDYEAQRHWQEITFNLPLKDWYENTTQNDLMYWGLDYPPLTAYHSYLIGLVANGVNSSFVKLYESRGISTNQHKSFMRNTVLLADLLLYIPAVIYASNVIFYKLLKLNNETFHWIYLLLATLYPGQILIDNGHFQYNNISLGLTLLAIASILINRRLIAAALFVCALNYKQMELYHAVPFFCYLLGNCFIDPDTHKKYSTVKGLIRLCALGSVVLSIFALIWFPWLTISLDSVLQVLHRIFPLDRGVFEDKVSNVWCVINIFIKLKQKFTNQAMAKICLASTLTAITPSSISLLFKPKKRQFLYAIANSSMAFFLFSFQVHEKSILIAAAPIALLFPLEPFISLWFLQIATFSMLPLFVKDGLTCAFVGTSGAFYLITKIIIDASKDGKLKNLSFLQVLWNLNGNNNKQKHIEAYIIKLYQLSLVVQIILTLAFFFVSPPSHLPFLHPLLNSVYSCCHFVFFFLYLNVKQVFYE